MNEPTTPTGKRLASCLWSWHGLSCALLRGHPSPHHIIGEQPQFAAIEAQAATAERERLLAEGWREPHRHMFTSFGDPNPTTQCAGESCGVLYGDLHPEPA